MAAALDALDRKILAALQEDASRNLEDLARHVGGSKTPVWNRIRKLKEA
ncbi:MAG: AsnC family transcriptional regulator, partial [Pseudomonadota bacterium]